MEVREMFKSGRKYWLIIVVAAALMAGSVDRSLATDLKITNPGFEAVTALAEGRGSYMNIPGWDLDLSTGQYGTWNPKSTSYNQDYSGNIGWINDGYIIQDISSLNGNLGYLNANHLYTLSVDVGYRLTSDCPKCLTRDWTIELLAGGEVFLTQS